MIEGQDYHLGIKSQIFIHRPVCDAKRTKIHINVDVLISCIIPLLNIQIPFMIFGLFFFTPGL